MSVERKPRFITPPNKLKAKVGNGGIDESLITKAQVHIESNSSKGFLEYAQRYLATIRKEVALRKKNTDPDAPLSDLMVNAIMQLKANGGMFQFPLVSEVAEIGLHFIENISSIKGDALDVILVHANTIEVIVKGGLHGDGGQEGYALLQELNKACNRYFKKHEKPAPKKKK